MIRIGRLRHYVTIEQPVQTRSASGAAVVTSWSTVATNVPCSIDPISGREFLAAGQVQSEVDTKITLRTFPGLTTAMRINANGVLYDIRAVLPDPTQRSHMLVMCKSGINRG